MEILNICNSNQEDLKQLRECDFSHHFSDIDDNKLIQVTVNKLDETTEKLGYDTKTITQYEIITIYQNSDDQKVKRSTKIEQQKKVSRIPKRVLERKNLAKFGKAAISNEGVTMLGDEVRIQMVGEDFNNDEDLKQKMNRMKAIKENPNMKFSDRRKLKEYHSSSHTISEPPKEPERLKYISPGRRNNKKYTIHISGFMPDFTRNDFLDLIPRDINFNRVTLPSFNNKCKGYGFIDVNNEKEMNTIIEYFDKKPYKHMILHANCKK